MTAPGETAMFSPSLNGLRLTIDGMPWLRSMSRVRLTAPLPDAEAAGVVDSA